jgi:hypothetical protein
MSDNVQVFPIKEQIEARAYELYLERGGEDGHALEDWFTAERELIQEHAKSDSTPLKARAATASVDN